MYKKMIALFISVALLISATTLAAFADGGEPTEASTEDPAESDGEALAALVGEEISLFGTGDGQCDLIVTDITTTPSNPKVGDAVTLSAVVKNIGTGATPSGIKHSVRFSVGTLNNYFSWIDNYLTPISPSPPITAMLPPLTCRTPVILNFKWTTI